MASAVKNNPSAQRYELEMDGHTAFIDYKLKPGVITLVHTEVPAALGGRGVGSTLVRGVLDDVRKLGLKAVVLCEFIRGYIGKHPEYQDLM